MTLEKTLVIEFTPEPADELKNLPENLFWNKIQANIWKIVSNYFYKPKEGSYTTGGLVLKKDLSMQDSPYERFAAFSDSRFNTKWCYERFLPFIPEDIKIIGPPNGENCFQHCSGISKKQKKRLNRKDFDRWLEENDYKTISLEEVTLEDNIVRWDEEPKIGDIITYYISDPFGLSSRCTHAGKYVGKGRVQSRWGYNSPLIEHFIKEVVPTFWNSKYGSLCIERPKDPYLNHNDKTSKFQN